jgi:hypothetical protein
MPIYKGSNEVTSGNLKKGSTNIENGYKATNPFYTNQTTITFSNFTVNASGTPPTGVTIAPAISSITGAPGASWSTTFAVTAPSGKGVGGTGGTYGTTSYSWTPNTTIVPSIGGSSGRATNVMTYSLSGTFPSQSSTLSVNVNNIVIYNSPGLSFTGPGSSSSGSIGNYAFSWNGSGRGVISYGGYYPAANDPLYPANFHDNVNVNVGNQGSSSLVDFSNTPQSAGVYGPVGISSDSTGGTKSPSTAQYYGVGGNTSASTNSGTFSVQGPFSSASTAGSTSVSFQVYVDDINYYMYEIASISVTIT